MARLIDQTVLIVGASSGIGAQVARDVAGHGNRVVIVARRATELATVAEDVRAAGSACLDIVADALDPAAAAAAVAKAVGEYGSIDVALLNAGQGPDMSMAESGVDDVTRIMASPEDPRHLSGFPAVPSPPVRRTGPDWRRGRRPLAG